MKSKIPQRDTKPNAWIVNPSDRGRKSIKSGNNIYLNDNQEFLIELFNPLTDAVLADIKVNGKSVSKSGLILRPGERFYLDCFVDDKKKFMFKTYEVEDTSESINAIQKNGTVEVFFYKEETINLSRTIRERWDRYIERHYYPIWYYGYPNYTYYGSYPSNTIVGGVFPQNSGGKIPPIVGGNVYTQTIQSNLNTPVSLNNIGSYTTNTVQYSSLNNACVSYTSTVETGRIEKGETSTQNFTEVDMEFEKFHISSVVYKLLPQSQKPIETSELKKKYCDECGSKVLKETSKFCHECGNKI